MFDPLGLVSIISSIEMHSPPALSIFCCAFAENFNATTFTFLSNSPLDKTLPGTKIVSSATACLLMSDKFTSAVLLFDLESLSATSFQIAASSLFDCLLSLLISSIRLGLVFIYSSFSLKLINFSAFSPNLSQAFNNTSLGGIAPSVSILNMKSFSRYPTLM